jgi:D-3-phosphoglycerate dehydrogenase / 2-oxoglutarate reductase
MMDVLVVESLQSDVLNWLEARHAVHFAPELAQDPAALAAALALTRAVVIPPSAALDAATIKKALRLRLVARLAVGTENIDLEACARNGIEVVRPASASAAAEAEFVISALLAMLRRVPIVNAEGLLVGRELGACTVGLVGMTPAVQPLARLLKAFGAKVLGYDPSVHTSDALWSRHGIEAVGLRELMSRCDGVAVLLAFFSRYQGLFGERLFQGAREQQVLVSLAHSNLFDEHALAQALKQGPLAAAWMDSLEPGALDPDRPLHRVPTLQVTPRVSANTQESRLRGAWAVAQRIDEMLSSSPSTAMVAAPAAPPQRSSPETPPPYSTRASTPTAAQSAAAFR